jgi:hypothetical protein
MSPSRYRLYIREFACYNEGMTTTLTTRKATTSEIASWPTDPSVAAERAEWAVRLALPPRPVRIQHEVEARTGRMTQPGESSSCPCAECFAARGSAHVDHLRLVNSFA